MQLKITQKCEHTFCTGFNVCLFTAALFWILLSVEW
jgi:hypothetical protein